MKMLKEWSTVTGALEAGEQTVLLRKGGILETASGFSVESDRFIIYPTWEHQSAENIREPFRRHLDRERPERGTNRISSYAEVLAEADVSSDEAIAGLEPFHIWSPGYIQTRRTWEPQKPIKAIYLRVFLVDPAVVVPVRGEYAGCKSWLDLDRDVPAGEPVMDDARAASGLERFRGVVAL